MFRFVSQKNKHEPRNYQYHRLRRIFLHRPEFRAERHQKDQNRKPCWLYLFCDLWYFQRLPLAHHHSKCYFMWRSGLPFGQKGVN